MTRIIAGAVGGQRLRTPRGWGTRPTRDRVREALFSSLESRCGDLAGLRVLDLYAGSGALGLEAWSRGATTVTFCESDGQVARLLRQNARQLGMAAPDVRHGQVATTLARTPGEPYDLVLSDPPYALSDAAVEDDLAALVTRHWLAPGALVVVERPVQSPEPRWPDGLAPGRHKGYGDTVLWYGHAS